MRLKYGIAPLIVATVVSVRAIRGSASPGPGRSDSASTGSRLSQYGSDRSAGSAANKLCRWVVPVRGRPAITIGRAISTSWISGWRSSRSWISRRFFSSAVICTQAPTWPAALRPPSSRNARHNTSSRSS